METENTNNPTDTGKNSINQNIITICVVVIALSLFVQTILKLSGIGEPESTSSVSTQTPPQQQVPNIANNTTVQFSDTEFDFGDVKSGEKPKHTFKVTNTGTNPLLITNTTVDNGITVLSWTKESVAPQQAAEIVVELNSDTYDGKPKSIHLNMNTAPAHQHLVIKGKVAK